MTSRYATNIVHGQKQSVHVLVAIGVNVNQSVDRIYSKESHSRLRIRTFVYVRARDRRVTYVQRSSQSVKSEWKLTKRRPAVRGIMIKSRGGKGKMKEEEGEEEDEDRSG